MLYDNMKKSLSADMEKFKHIDSLIRTLPFESPLRSLLITIVPILSTRINAVLNNPGLPGSDAELAQALELNNMAKNLLVLHSLTENTGSEIDVTPSQFKAWLDLSSHLGQNQSFSKDIFITKMNILDMMIHQIRQTGSEISDNVFNNLAHIQTLIGKYYETPHTPEKLQKLDSMLNSILIYLAHLSRPSTQKNIALFILKDVKAALDNMAPVNGLLGRVFQSEEAKCLQHLRESIDDQETLAHRS